MKQNFIITSLILCMLTSCSNKKKINTVLAQNYLDQSREAATKNKREALALADQSIKTCPTPQAYALKATLLFQIGHYEDSLKLFEKVMRDKSTSVHLKTAITNNYACNLIALGMYDKARETWLDLSENRHYLSPEVAIFNLGLLEFSLVPEKSKLNPNEISQLKKALNYFNQAIKINHEYIDSYYYSSLTLVRLNELEAAKQQLIQVIGIMPEHESAKKLLVHIDQLKAKAKTTVQKKR